MSRVDEKKTTKRLTRGSMVHIKEKEEDIKEGNKALDSIYNTCKRRDECVCLLVEVD